MKIAFVVHTAYPEFIGGREHHVHNLASVLSKTDDVVVISGGSKEQKRSLDGYVLVTLPMVSIKISNNPLQIYRIIPKLFLSLKQERPDLIHAFEYGSYSTDVSCLYSKTYNIPLFLTVYGYQFKNSFLNIFKMFYDYLFGRILLNKANKIFYTSTVQYEEISKVFGRGLIDRKAIFQENCIQIENYSNITINEEILKKYNLKDEVKLLTVARMLPRKGIKYLIFALDNIIKKYRFTHIKLMIIGPNCGEEDNIKSLIKKLRLEKNVLIIGPIPYGQVKDFIAICDIFILPSLYEGFPLALLEAMAAGRAVIFTDLPCAKEIITNGKDGLLVKPGDVDSLTRAILRVSSDRKFREHLGFNAKQKAERFDSRIEAQKVRKTYEEVIDFAMKKYCFIQENITGYES